MSVTQEEVQKIANLSKLNLNNEEKITENINSTLKWVEQLNEVDTKWVKWTVNVLDLYNPMREDTIATEKNPDLFSATKQKVVANQIALNNIMK